MALGLVGVVCLLIALAASFNDWDQVWSLAFPIGFVLMLVARLWRWWFERRVAATSGP